MDHHSSPTNGTTLILLLLVIAGVYLVFFSDAQPKIQAVEDLEGDTFSRGEEVQELPEESEEDSEEAQEEQQEQEEIITNACGHENFGLPDYEGTTKEGLDCADAFYLDRDLECLANPPLNYDGTIDLASQISNPHLSCCSDGTCQWT